MSESLKILLGHAAKEFGQCAKLVDAKGSSLGLTPLEYERLLGLGMAFDWIGRARHLESINYSDKKFSKSDRAYALTELTRFTFMWTAVNALFARLSVLELLDKSAPSKNNELDRFRILYKNCGMPPSDVASAEKNLHALLKLPMHVQHFPWPSVNHPPTILEVIYYKHTVAGEQTRGTGKKIHQAIVNKNYAALDLPTLIYATRNWNIHGVLLSSSFRGTRKKFNLWIDVVNLALAQVLKGSANALLKVV